MSLLLIRTSSMGDVILTLPVLRAFAATYPGEELVYVTKKPFDRFIEGIPGVRLFLTDHHGRHKGLAGLFRAYRDIRSQYNITAVADLHDVLRSQVWRFLFRLSGCRVASINKGRGAKRRLVRGELRQPLRHTVLRYADTMAGAGYPLQPGPGPWLMPKKEYLDIVSGRLSLKKGALVGVAPLAKHKLKMWPEEKMEILLNILVKETGCSIFLFGSPDEAEKISSLASRVPGAESVAGNIGLDEEIALISKLDLMVAMDSSNMHLASMLGVTTLSIWGATHPWAGFSAWDTPDEYQIQIPVEELSCRPCTIYGKGECRRGDLACLNMISPQSIFNRVTALLSDK